MKEKKHAASGLLGLIILLLLSGFVFLAFQDQAFSITPIIIGGILAALFVLHYTICLVLFPGIDPFPIIISYVLVSIGMIILWRLKPDIGQRQLIWVAAGLTGMIVIMLLLREPAHWIRYRYIFMIGALGLLALVLVVGQVQGGAKNWIGIGGFSFQPSEFIKVILIYVLAAELSMKRKVRQLIWPLLTFCILATGLLVLARDLGGALIYASTTLILFYLGTGNLAATGLGIAGGVVGSIAAYQLFDHVKIRVAAWRNPWSSYESSGFQIAHGLMAIASGGLFGRGLTLGNAKIIPAYYTDYIFAVICLEMGQIVGIAIICFFILLILRGIAAAMQSHNSFNALLAMGVISLLAIQTFLIIGGVLKMIPLTGVTLPFVSYGGSSIIGSFLLLGILEAVIVDNKRTSQ